MKKLLIIILIAFVAIQFVPIKKENPSVTADFNGPAEVKEIFQTSCYDCHSNETNWVWYTSIAPISWFVAHNVNEGREHLNFSNWQNKSDNYMLKMRREIWEEIDDGEMPMKIHTIIHRDAVLSAEQKEVIKNWSANY